MNIYFDGMSAFSVQEITGSRIAVEHLHHLFAELYAGRMTQQQVSSAFSQTFELSLLEQTEVVANVQIRSNNPD